MYKQVRAADILRIVSNGNVPFELGVTAWNIEYNISNAAFANHRSFREVTTP